MNEFEEVMRDRLGESWFKVLRDEINSDYFQKIAMWVGQRRQSATIYPESEDVFKAYKLSPFDKTKVIILGQDPYTDGSADGLCFSYKNGMKASGKKKSLDVIFDELEEDIKFGLYIEQDYNLKWLAEQGVFLLNTVLTVERNKVGSHADRKVVGWQNFTGKSIAYLAMDKTPKVFMLWGNQAQEIFHLVMKYFNVDLSKHLVLEARHPAADIHDFPIGDIIPNYPVTFRGCKHFSKANEFLKSNYQKEIIW